MKAKKILAMVLLCLLCTMGFSLNDNAQAAVGNNGGIADLQYKYTKRISTGLSISSSGRASCSAKIRVYDADSTVSMTMKLRRKDGSVWRAVKTWTDSGSGSIDFSMAKEYTVIRGTYTLYVTATITTVEGKSETVSITSVTQTY